MNEPSTNSSSRPPTQIQLDTLAFMHAFIAEHGYPPTVREIALHFGLRSMNAVISRLLLMQRKGLVRNTPRASRGWRPV